MPQPRPGRAPRSSYTWVLATAFAGVLPVPLAHAQTPTDWVPARLLAGRPEQMAYDIARERTVMLPHPCNATYEWDGDVWILHEPLVHPSPRHGHGMAYDAARRRVVLFGGWAPGWQRSASLDDTWEWDGTSWIQRHPVTTPPRRENAMMAYDAARQCVVMFAGQSSDGRNAIQLTDTWEWDGTNWTQRHHTATVPRSWEFAMVYDTARKNVVLFVEYGHEVQGWDWSGSNWVQRRDLSLWAGQRQGSAITYDVARQRFVLFRARSGLAPSEHWESDGSNRWTQVTPTTIPPPRGYHVMACDAARQRVVLFGGAGASGHLADTWEWDGKDWRIRSTSAIPLAIAAPQTDALFYDAVRRRVVMLGGDCDSHTGWSEMWDWDGVRWNELPPPPLRGRCWAGLTFDAARRRLVVFGGARRGSEWAFFPDADTWEWDGSVWSKHQPKSAPAARYQHAMAYEWARNKTVLFGGRDRLAVFGDTWDWDGSTWTQVSSTGPLARSGHAMAYEIGRQRVLMFGGTDLNAWFNDTWEWDGRSWTWLTPASSPPARSGHAMTYDMARHRVVLVGGSDASGRRSDTWEWDGSNWSERRTTHAPPPDVAGVATIAYDRWRDRVVLLSGISTWLYGTLTPAASTPIGTACPATGPVLTSSVPHVGNAHLALDLLHTRPSTPCVIGLSSATQQLAIGAGCFLYLSEPLVPLIAVSNAHGFASIRLSIPPDTSWRGVRAYAQGFVLDPQGPILGLALSAGLRLTIGD